MRCGVGGRPQAHDPACRYVGAHSAQPRPRRTRTGATHETSSRGPHTMRGLATFHTAFHAVHDRPTGILGWYLAAHSKSRGPGGLLRDPPTYSTCARRQAS